MENWYEDDSLPPLLRRLSNAHGDARRPRSERVRHQAHDQRPFHLQHNTTPSVVEAVLLCAEDAQERLGISGGTWSKITPFLRQLGLVDSDLQLTQFGSTLRTLAMERPGCLCEAVSCRLGSQYLSERLLRFSFAYRALCDWLWTESACILDRPKLTQVADSVRHLAGVKYGLDVAEVAFSENSVRGGLHWLKGLNPPAVSFHTESRRWCFRRRVRCETLALLWVLSRWYEVRELALGEWVEWSDEVALFTSRMLLIEPGTVTDLVCECAFAHGSVLDVMAGGDNVQAWHLTRLVPVGSIV